MTANVISASRAASISGEMPIPRTKTLVVDDDRGARELMKRILVRAGYEVFVAADAEEALSQFQRHEPDLVLMDVVLPGMSGVDALRAMKQARRDRWLPVILISVRDTSEEILEGLKAGADDYLTKPVVIEQLLAKLRNVGESLAVHARLRASLHFSRALMDHLNEGLVCVDEQGLIVANNRVAETLFGFEPGRMLGVDARRPLFDDRPTERLSQGATLETVGIGRREDGARFPISLRESAVDVDGRNVIVITVRDITEQLREERRALNDAARLEEYHAAHEAENELAGRMLDRLLRRDRSIVRSVRSSTEAVAGFSGDVVAAARSPGGKLFVMLADATGHGLTAAISLVPALSVLHAMVARELPLVEIVAELNSKLVDALPVGRFLAAAIVCLDQARNSGAIWVGGVPAVLLLDRDGKIERRFESTQLPLGIVPSSEAMNVTEAFMWDRPLQLLLVSDGILEAENATGEPFGEERLLRAVRETEGRDRIASVKNALALHLGGLKAFDDASVAFVDLD